MSGEREELGRYFVIADDLTGANAVGALLQKEGVTSCICLEEIDNAWGRTEQYSAVITSTGSRNLSREEAYRLVQKRMEQYYKIEAPPLLLSKRTDSTLRGNIGSEIDAVLDFLGSEYVMAVVPAFPDAGRMVTGGRLFVNGVLLEFTEAARDPMMPVTSSDIREIIGRQSKYQIGRVDIKEIRKEKTSLMSALCHCTHIHNRIIVFDSETNEDLYSIAEALITSGIKFAAADPGPFTRAVAKAQILKYSPYEKILLLIGSVNSATEKQIKKLWSVWGKHTTVLVCTRRLLKGDEERKSEIARVVNRCMELYESSEMAVVVGDGIFPENRIDFADLANNCHRDAEYYSSLINEGFSEIAETVTENEKTLKNFYVSGGDIALALLKKTGAKGIIPCEEVVPLAVLGTVFGGSLDGARMITKGGMAGDETAIVKCAAYLRGCEGC